MEKEDEPDDSQTCPSLHGRDGGVGWDDVANISLIDMVLHAARDGIGYLIYVFSLMLIKNMLSISSMQCLLGVIFCACIKRSTKFEYLTQDV